MNNFTFLTENEAFEDTKLDILKIYGTKCAITDLAILLGGYVSSEHYTNNEERLENRTGWWWTKTTGEDGKVYAVSAGGFKGISKTDIEFGGIRPIIKYSDIADDVLKESVDEFGVKTILYGEYPQMVVSRDIANKLELEYNSVIFNETGRNYTTGFDTNLKKGKNKYPEIEYAKKRYIRFIGKNNDDTVLSNGEKLQIKKNYWLEIAPIEWIVDESADIAISKKIIFSGIPFDSKKYQGNFNNADIKKFMDNYLSKEIIAPRAYSQLQDRNYIKSYSKNKHRN